MVIYSSKEARENFSDVISQVAFSGERVVVTRQGKELVAVVPISDLNLLEKLQDRIDLEEAHEALLETKKKGTVPWKKLKAELGL